MNDSREASVQQPFSEKESKKLQALNIYLDRMTAQIKEKWQNPYKGGRIHRGIVRIYVDPYGNLERVRVFRSSSIRALDNSVVAAIKAVGRFKVPSNPDIVRKYYWRMNFHYSSIEDSFELLPYEQE